MRLVDCAYHDLQEVAVRILVWRNDPKTSVRLVATESGAEVLHVLLHDLLATWRAHGSSNPNWIVEGGNAQRPTNLMPTRSQKLRNAASMPDGSATEQAHAPWQASVHWCSWVWWTHRF